MSGLFRRLRQRKATPEEDPEASSEPSAESGDSDIYPHRKPPRRGDPDIETEPSPTPDAEGDVGAEPTPLPEEIGPPPLDETSPEAPVPPAPPEGIVPPAPPPEDLPSGPPPKLPEADADGARSAHRPLAAPSRCFVCGTDMTGSYCPTCRMTWTE
ncbi:MAG TPA: hypothetical protein VJQ43_00210 [Thermoplasmata archaeon]|nr:hypothetical protein [Thermoplasmata archaeon]